MESSSKGFFRGSNPQFFSTPILWGYGSSPGMCQCYRILWENGQGGSISRDVPWLEGMSWICNNMCVLVIIYTHINIYIYIIQKNINTWYKTCTVLQLHNVKLEQTKHTYTWVLRDFLWMRIYTWNTSSLVAAYCVILDSKWMVWYVSCFLHDLEGNSPNMYSATSKNPTRSMYGMYLVIPKAKKTCHNHDPGGHACILSFRSSNSNSKWQKIHREKTTGRWNFPWNLFG